MVLGTRSYIMLVVVSLASMWINAMFSKQSVQLSATPSEGIDYFSKNFEMMVTDEKGVKKHRLEAMSMAHFSGRDSTNLEKPVLTLFHQNRPPWIIRSDTGTISPDGARIFFGGKVFVDRKGTEDVRTVNIVTSNLWLEPEKKFAETEEWADIYSESEKLSGTGLRVFFSSPVRLNLVSNVQGRYAVY